VYSVSAEKVSFKSLLSSVFVSLHFILFYFILFIIIFFFFCSTIEPSTATPTATEETTTPDAISSQEPVLLKRYPRQAVVGPSPTNPAVAGPTQLPIQKSNVVAERIRLMTQADNNQPRKMPPSGSSSSSTAIPPVSNIVTLYKVNGEAFESCDITNGQRIGQVKSQDPESHTGIITLPPGLLSIADNFFLGKLVPFH
jgi:hypothetical protein